MRHFLLCLLATTVVASLPIRNNQDLPTTINQGSPPIGGIQIFNQGSGINGSALFKAALEHSLNGTVNIPTIENEDFINLYLKPYLEVNALSYVSDMELYIIGKTCQVNITDSQGMAECISVANVPNDILDSMTGAINDFIKSNFSSEIFEVVSINKTSDFALGQKGGGYCGPDGWCGDMALKPGTLDIVDNVYRLALFDLPYGSLTLMLNMNNGIINIKYLYTGGTIHAINRCGEGVDHRRVGGGCPLDIYSDRLLDVSFPDPVSPAPWEKTSGRLYNPMEILKVIETANIVIRRCLDNRCYPDAILPADSVITY